MTSALVTGGAGFIGSHLVEGLLARGCSVRVLDNFATGRRENLAGVAQSIELIEGDVRDLAATREAMRGVETVFHLAALPSVARSVQNPLETNAANVTGTLHVLLSARDAGVKRVVCAASSSAYGNQPVLPKVETMAPDPLSPYAVSKLAGEMYARAFARVYGLPTVVLRYFNVFGPRQDPATQYAGVIARFAACALQGRPFPVHGDGEQSRDFTYVENVVQANLLAADAPAEGCPVINIAYGRRTTLNELCAMFNELTGQNLPVQHRAASAGDVRHSHADIALARRLLGYEPRVDVREGLRRTLAWYRAALTA